MFEALGLLSPHTPLSTLETAGNYQSNIKTILSSFLSLLLLFLCVSKRKREDRDLDFLRAAIFFSPLN